MAGSNLVLKTKQLKAHTSNKVINKQNQLILYSNKTFKGVYHHWYQNLNIYKRKNDDSRVDKII